MTHRFAAAFARLHHKIAIRFGERQYKKIVKSPTNVLALPSGYKVYQFVGWRGLSAD
jgi:hypothetical protein